MDINKRLDEILVGHGLIKAATPDEAIKVAQRCEQMHLEGRRVALYGLGVEVWPLLAFLFQHAPLLRLATCIDKTKRTLQYKGIILDTEVHNVEEIGSLGVDCVILGSMIFEQELRAELAKNGYTGETADVFGAAADYLDGHFIDYRMLATDRQKLRNAAPEDRAAALERMIKDYLVIRDFKSAFFHINRYIVENLPGSKRMASLKAGLEQLLADIKLMLDTRKCRDVIINWVDAISWYDIPNFPFLKKMAEEGLEFRNTYTVMPWTTETTKTVMFGELPIEGKLFQRNEISVENAALLKNLAGAGYDFAYCGLPRMSRFYDGNVKIPMGLYDNKWSSSVPRQWDALALLCSCDEPLCIIIHTLRETHEPFICGELDTEPRWFGSTKKDWAQEACRSQAEAAGKYIDGQLEFYSEYYGKNSVRIYMGDHGRVANSPMDENKIHVMLSMTGPGIPMGKEDRMFSLVNLRHIVTGAINGKISDEAFADYVTIENLDAYDYTAIMDALSGRLSLEEMLQCRGVVTKTDSYFLYADGTEHYFLDKRIHDDRINDGQYAGRIQKLRGLCGNEFIDISKYDKFKYSRLLYEKKEK